MQRKTAFSFLHFSDEETSLLRKQGNVTHETYADEINKIYPGDTYKPANYLKEVQTFLEYKP